MNTDRDQLSATGYLLDQTGMGGLGFVYGQFRTFQVPLSHLEELTGLDWAALRPFDPLEGTALSRPVDGVDELVL